MKNWKPGEPNGAAAKFIVLKQEDVNKHLTPLEQDLLARTLQNIRNGRIAGGKSGSNFYLVVNTDEPYAEQLADIMQAYGHWGETPCGRGPVNED